MPETREVVTCGTCKGYGETEDYNYVLDNRGRADYTRSNEWTLKLVPCRHCGGSGRMLKITTVHYERLPEKETTKG